MTKQKAVFKKCKWVTPEGNNLELSAGYPLVDAMGSMIFSLSNEEIGALMLDMQNLLFERKSLGIPPKMDITLPPRKIHKNIDLGYEKALKSGFNLCLDETMLHLKSQGLNVIEPVPEPQEPDALHP